MHILSIFYPPIIFWRIFYRGELKEELGIEVLSAKPYLSTHGRSKDVEFDLHLLRVESFVGEPKPLEAEAAFFFTLDEALSLPLCEADERLLKMLR